MYQPIYYTSTSLLVFSRYRRLLRIKCPFKVKATQEDEGVQKDQVYYVHHVYPCDQHRLLYEISGRTYPYNTFNIILKED